jgi:hypothetical protein
MTLDDNQRGTKTAASPAAGPGVPEAGREDRSGRTGDLTEAERLMADALFFAGLRVTAETMRTIAGIHQEHGRPLAGRLRRIADLLDPGAGRSSFPEMTGARWERFRADLEITVAEALALWGPLVPRDAAAVRADAVRAAGLGVDMPVVRLAAAPASRQDGRA